MPEGLERLIGRTARELFGGCMAGWLGDLLGDGFRRARRTRAVARDMTQVITHGRTILVVEALEPIHTILSVSGPFFVYATIPTTTPLSARLYHD